MATRLTTATSATDSAGITSSSGSVTFNISLNAFPHDDGDDDHGEEEQQTTEDHRLEEAQHLAHHGHPLLSPSFWPGVDACCDRAGSCHYLRSALN